MIGARRIALARRRERLVVAGERARDRVDGALAALRGPAARVDRGVEAVHWLRDRPWLVGLGVFALTLIARRRALALAALAWQGWRLYGRARGLVRGSPRATVFATRAADAALGWWQRRLARRRAAGAVERG